MIFCNERTFVKNFRTRPYVYLAGGQQFSEDDGVGWREKATRLLDEIGCDVFDPTKEESWVIDKYGPAWRDLVNTDQRTYFKIGSELIEFDERKMAEDTDILLVYWDHSAERGGGTKSEITWAYQLEIPVFVFTEKGAKETIPTMPLWTLGGIQNPDNIVDSLEEAVDAIRVYLDDSIQLTSLLNSVAKKMVCGEGTEEVLSPTDLTNLYYVGGYSLDPRDVLGDEGD